MTAPRIGGGHVPIDPGTNKLWGSDGAGAAKAIPGVYQASVTLTAAQVLACFTTPVTVVPAPGAGNTLVPVGVFWNYTFVTTAYTDHTGSLALRWGSGKGASNGIATASFWTAASSQGMMDGLSGSTAGAISSVYANQPLVAQQTAANPTGGDGTVTVTVAYFTLSVA